MIYLDNHATTPLDPVALEAMLPFLKHQYANPGSITHHFGRSVAAQVQDAIASISQMIGAADDELVITSGATESNNLALLGSLLHPRQKRRKIVSLVTEHKAVLDPLKRLQGLGFEVKLVKVADQHSDLPGYVDFEELQQVIDDQTALVSVMLVNNEIGIIQPIEQIAQLCRKHGVMLHTDATQGVGRIDCNVNQLDVDLLSFSAHKFYGPKGIGGLFVRRRERAVRLQAQILGGGQQHNLRSGTLNPAGIVGMHAALANSLGQAAQDQKHIIKLRSQLYHGLRTLGSFSLNGPNLDSETRVAGNLNLCFFPMEGQSLMMHAPDLAISSGSACTSANPEPSHVLLALGLSEDHARSSLRFGIGKFNTTSEITLAVDMLKAAVEKLSNFT